MHKIAYRKNTKIVPNIKRSAWFLILFSYNAVADQNNCELSNILCIGPGQEYDTDGRDHSKTFQSAADSVRPGDIIKIKGGSYNHDRRKSQSVVFVNFKLSGTYNNPIRIEPFLNEHVVIEGFSFSEGDVGPARRDEFLIYVSGDHVQVRNIELAYSSRYGLVASGDYGVFENLEVHDSWGSNILLHAEFKTIRKNRFSNIDSYRSRHGSGLWIVPSSRNPLRALETIVEHSLFYNNGYQPNGEKVPPISGDPKGGGNSDGINVFKACHDNAKSHNFINMCSNTSIRGNITWHNADDGIDNSGGEGTIIQNNITFENGPEGNRGIKIYSYVDGGLTIVGNTAFAHSGFAIEGRFNKEAYIYNNTSINNQTIGISIGVRNIEPGNTMFINNLAAFNGGNNDYRLMGGEINALTNWSEQAPTRRGDPDLVDHGLSAKNLAYYFAAPLTIAQKVKLIRTRVATAFSPTQASPLVDAGTIIPNIHCPSSDDDDRDNSARNIDCRHWAGVAPDIGAFEFGL